ncbi:MAG: hypothetical protein MJ138_07220 [Kiritimatiellae bacterium]|nr:hypothetical protein [Kiritimatiellia bacterium]
MHIDKFEEAIMNCRFCFMCRHLSTIGQVRCTEVDTPRVRAAMLFGLRNGTNSFDDADFVDALYRQELSACCRRNCVNGYDENGLALAARADVVEQGKAPEKVAKLAKKLAATSAWKAAGKGKVALFLDDATASDKQEVAALQKLVKAAVGDCVTVTGGCIGKALKVLGYLGEARAAAAKFAEFLNGLGVEAVVCPNPAAFDALKNDYPAWGLELKPTVFCTAGFLLAKKVKFAKKPGALYYLADDFMRNYCGCECPEKLLAALKADLKPFGTNDEESYNCGEGAIVLDKLEPALVKRLAQYVAARADDPKKDQIVTLGVYAKTQLVKHGKLNVKTLNEIAAACL